MEHLFTLYIITRLDTFGNVAAFLTFCFAGAAFVAFIMGLDGSDKAKQTMKKLIIASACSLTVFVLTPTQKDAMFVAGGIGVIEAAKSETVQRVASQSVEAVERWLTSVAPKKE